MASVDVAMARSLREGAVNLLVASLRPAIERRDAVSDAQDQITDVKTAFSSWDNCMQAAFCKWPVIAVIIVGGLIIVSILYCIGRCLCCGLSCCCECCYCLKCCGDCCGCCDPPRGRRHKYLDEPYIPPNQGYRTEAPMTAGIAPPRAKAAEPPQYAEFDVARKGGEDALPEMPSWESAGSKKIMMEEEAVEMDQLKRPESPGQAAPLMNGAAPGGPASPLTPDGRSPYGAQGAQPAAGGYLGAGASAANSPYGAHSQGYDHVAPPYGQSQTSFGTDQSYGVTGAAAVPPTGPGRRSPLDYANGGFGAPPMDPGYRGTPGPDYNNSPYGQNGPGGPGMSQGYGPGPGRRSPGGPNMMGGLGYPPRSTQSPGPQGLGFPPRGTQSPGPQMGGYPGRGPNSPGPRGPPAGYPGRERQPPSQQGDYGYGYGNGNGNGYEDRRSPAPQGEHAAGGYYNGSRPYPPPGHDRPYPPRGAPERQYSSDSARPLAGPPRRQDSHEQAPPSPTAPQNVAGFDFGSGFSRSQARDHEQHPGESRGGFGGGLGGGLGGEAQPGALGGGAAGYPGYVAYRPSADRSRPPQDGWSGL